MVTRLTDVLMDCLAQQDSWHVYLLRHWNDIMGELHTQVCLERISGETLILGVHDVHWMQELFCLAQELITHINNRLGHNYVKNVRFVLSSSRHNPQKINKRAAQQRSVTIATPTTVNEKKLTERQHKALGEITDPQLKDLLRQLMVRGSS